MDTRRSLGSWQVEAGSDWRAQRETLRFLSEPREPRFSGRLFNPGQTSMESSSSAGSVQMDSGRLSPQNERTISFLREGGKGGPSSVHVLRAFPTSSCCNAVILARHCGKWVRLRARIEAALEANKGVEVLRQLLKVPAVEAQGLEPCERSKGLRQEGELPGGDAAAAQAREVPDALRQLPQLQELQGEVCEPERAARDSGTSWSLLLLRWSFRRDTSSPRSQGSAFMRRETRQVRWRRDEPSSGSEEAVA